jgi:hypothetical protein
MPHRKEPRIPDAVLDQLLAGAADVSSSDGQHFPTAGPGEAVGAVNAHYEHTASTLFYTHLSARQAPYHTIAIPPSGEAAYVIDGLLYHEADLSIGTHHTDGGAVSDHNFALVYLLGFYFAPRIPNLAERRLYTFEPKSGSCGFAASGSGVGFNLCVLAQAACRRRGGSSWRPLRYLTMARLRMRYQRSRSVNCSAVLRSSAKNAAIRVSAWRAR